MTLTEHTIHDEHVQRVVVDAFTNATFVQLDENEPWLRIDNVDEDQLVAACHDENDGIIPRDLYIDLTEIQPAKVKFKRLVDWSIPPESLEK